MRKRKLLVIVAVVVGIVLAASLAAFFIQKSRITPEKAFEEYQRKSIQQSF